MMPETLRIFGKRYAVRQEPESKLDQRLQGSINHQSGEIAIGSGLSEDQERESLLHEVIHAIEHELQLELSEKQVGALSVALYSLAADNPAVVRFMLNLDGGT